jgi:hypothetical protein
MDCLDELPSRPISSNGGTVHFALIWVNGAPRPDDGVNLGPILGALRLDSGGRYRD